MAAGTLVVKDASNVSQSLSVNQDTTNANALIGTTSITDPVTGLKSVVSAVGNADAVALGATVYGQLAGGPNLLLNAAGTFDRQRSAVGTVGVAAVNTEGTKATYSVVIPDAVPPATATDFITLVGSASKTIRITRIEIEGDATAAALADIYVYKRTAADTGGTATQPAITYHDSTDAAPTAVANLYSVLPTGLGAGTLARAGRLYLPAAGTPTGANIKLFDFSVRNEKALVLRGVAQSMAINWGGAAVPAGTSLYITISFTEE